LESHELRSQKDARLGLRDETITLIKSDKIDPAKLETVKQKMNDLNKELQDFLIGKMVDFHKSMTPVQKDKAAKWMEKYSDEMLEMTK
jgi:Spy/CpxP family protein refolding chaperone